MTKTTELIQKIIEIVAEETEIDSERIVSRDRTTEVVDARHIIISVLAKIGIYTSVIAQSMKLTPRNVQYIITNFDDRKDCNKPLRNTYERIRKRLRNILETTTL